MIRVLDASIALKWFVQETGTEEAVAFKTDFLTDKILFAAPDLILYEIGHVLRSKKQFTEPAIKEALQSLLDMGIDIFAPTENSIARTVHWTFRTGLSFYDCLYVALAEQLGGRLLTADQEIYKKARRFIEIQLIRS